MHAYICIILKATIVFANEHELSMLLSLYGICRHSIYSNENPTKKWDKEAGYFP
jgi:hypothetical protein